MPRYRVDVEEVVVIHRKSNLTLSADSEDAAETTFWACAGRGGDAYWEITKHPKISMKTVKQVEDEK